MKIKLTILMFSLLISCKKKQSVQNINITDKKVLNKENQISDSIIFKEFGNKSLVDNDFPKEWKVNTYDDENIKLEKNDINSSLLLEKSNYFYTLNGKKIPNKTIYFNSFIKNDSLMSLSKIDSLFVLDSIVTNKQKLFFIKSFSKINDKKYESPILLYSIDLIMTKNNNYIKSLNIFKQESYPFFVKENIGYINKEGILTSKKFEIDEQKINYKGKNSINCKSFFY